MPRRCCARLGRPASPRGGTAWRRRQCGRKFSTQQGSNRTARRLDQQMTPRLTSPRCDCACAGRTMRRGAFTILALALWPGFSQAQTPAGAAPNARPEQADRMQFEWVREAGDCRTACRAWIAASGRLAETTVSDFDAFVQGLDVTGATVVLESAGGLVDAGLALGRAFRRLGLTTTVGRTVRATPDPVGERRGTLSPRATCASMCVFALLGGARRHVPDEARVLVHQIWPGKLR